MARCAHIRRQTTETTIELELTLEGRGDCSVSNPIGFFDHMIRSFCKHGLFDLAGSLEGDLHVDQHHLIEDTGIVLGQCFAKALGDCAGINRTGWALFPMDESLLCAAVDFGGRAFCVVDAGLSGIPLVSAVAGGTSSSFQTDCFEDFWQGFAGAARCNLHLKTLYGRSDHHKMEGLFKAAGKACCQAVATDPRRAGDIPSTKGTL